MQLIVTSLKQNKGQHAGLFNVRRLMRRIRTFGFYLVTLDIRQHADVHRDVIAQGLTYLQRLQRPPAERTQRLCEVIAKDNGVIDALDPNGKRAIGRLKPLHIVVIAIGPMPFLPFVVSGVDGADDVLSVLLLARSWLIL